MLFFPGVIKDMLCFVKRTEIERQDVTVKTWIFPCDSDYCGLWYWSFLSATVWSYSQSFTASLPLKLSIWSHMTIFECAIVRYSHLGCWSALLWYFLQFVDFRHPITSHLKAVPRSTPLLCSWLPWWKLPQHPTLPQTPAFVGRSVELSPSVVVISDSIRYFTWS